MSTAEPNRPTAPKVVGRRYAAFVLWGAAFFAAMLFASPGSASWQACACGAIGVAYSVHVFIRSGGARITPLGIYSFASGLFYFFPPIYLNFEPSATVLSGYHLAAVSILFVSNLLVGELLLRRSGFEREQHARANEGATKANSLLTALSGALCLASFAIAYLGGGSQFAGPAAFTGIIIFAFLSARSAIPAWVSLSFCAAFVYLYMEIVFTGFGRLVVGGLGLGIAMAFSARLPGLRVKIFLTIAVVPAMLFFIRERIDIVTEMRGSEASYGDGIGSILLPFRRFSELLSDYADGSIPSMLLEPFFAAAVVWVPRELWPGKPVGLGAVLSDYFRPDLAGVGHSELALMHGEWLLSFGILGVFAVPFVIALVLHGCEKFLLFSDGSGGVFYPVLAILFSAGVIDLLWGGTFTFTSRFIFRIAALVAFSLALALAAQLLGVRNASSGCANYSFASPDASGVESQPRSGACQIK